MRSILLAGVFASLTASAALAQVPPGFTSTFDTPNPSMALSLNVSRAVDYRITPMVLGSVLATSAGGTITISAADGSATYSGGVRANGVAASGGTIELSGYDQTVNGTFGTLAYPHTVTLTNATYPTRNVTVVMNSLNVTQGTLLETVNGGGNNSIQFQTLGDDAGDVTIRFGATVTIPARSPRGDYTGTLPITITYQ